ncbi:MAG: hypothetical protein ABFD91_06560 [Anaerohalosphaeraceae bacterium]
MAKLVYRIGTVTFGMLLVMALILFALGFWQRHSVVNAELLEITSSDALQKEAQQCLDRGELGEASRLMQRILSECPNSENIDWAQSNLAILNLLTQPNCDSGYLFLSEMMTKEPDAMGTGEVLYTAATILDKQKKQDQAKALYSHIQGHWVDTELGLKATVELVKKSPSVDDDPNGQQVIDQLKAQYGEMESLPEAIYSLAYHYGLSGDNVKALYTLQQIEQTWPDSSYAASSRMMSLAITSSADPNYTTQLFAETASVGKDIICLGSVADVAMMYAAKIRGEKTYKQNPNSSADIQKVIFLGQAYLNNDTSSTQAAQIAFQVAQGYYDLGDYQNAINYYTLVLTHWSTHTLAWHAKFRVGVCYQAMEKAGLMDTENARTLTAQVFNELVAEYPACPAVGAASRWLNSQNDSVEGRI